MPATVRPAGKARKIAWAILGVPLPLLSKKTKRDREINAQILREETTRVR